MADVKTCESWPTSLWPRVSLTYAKQVDNVCNLTNGLTIMVRCYIEMHISRGFNFPSGNGKFGQFPGREKPGNREKCIPYIPPFIAKFQYL